MLVILFNFPLVPVLRIIQDPNVLHNVTMSGVSLNAEVRAAENFGETKLIVEENYLPEQSSV